MSSGRLGHVDALLPADWHGTWLVTTEHGTETFFDFDYSLWLRAPARRSDGTTNWLGHDLRWVRLGLAPCEPDRLPGIRIGWRVHYGTGPETTSTRPRWSRSGE